MRPMWNDVADGAAGPQFDNGPQHRLRVTTLWVFHHEKHFPAPTTDRLITFCARPPWSSLSDLVGCFEHGLHMSQHHPRQTVMSMRLLLHASEDLCSSRRCSRQRHPLGWAFLHHRWRKGFLPGVMKVIVSCQILCYFMKSSRFKEN